MDALFCRIKDVLFDYPEGTSVLKEIVQVDTSATHSFALHSHVMSQPSLNCYALYSAECRRRWSDHSEVLF